MELIQLLSRHKKTNSVISQVNTPPNQAGPNRD